MLKVFQLKNKFPLLNGALEFKVYFKVEKDTVPELIKSTKSRCNNNKLAIHFIDGVATGCLSNI